jgi:ergothioneine biosynthesis protein EgtB
MSLLLRYKTIRDKTVELCAPLNTEDYVPQPVDFVSPPKWHLAHSTWFFEEMILTKHLVGYPVFDASFGFLFNSYYQSIGERAIRNQRGVITRPTVDEVYQYRKHVDEKMQKLLTSELSKELQELIILGLNHEQQHQELLITDLKFTLSLNPTFPVYKSGFSLVNEVNENSNWIKIDEGIYEIGHNSSEFCFDNELGHHKVYVHDFEISNSLVTNAEYIEFIEAGGYKNFQFWLDEGWSWVQENETIAPLYWEKKDGEWHYFTLSGFQSVDHNAILSHVSYYEAQAFATWKGMRLPTEFEWEIASNQLNWGKRWEWTNSAYLPYPHFKIAAGAVGEYNGKFMISQMVLRGGSSATAEGHSRNTYRNFFHPKHRWQVTGIRLVK